MALSAHELLRTARRDAGLTQAQLARRLGVSQAAVAKLERPGANPKVGTLARALAGTGNQLEIDAGPSPTVDITLIAAQLRRTPAQRLRGLESMYEQARDLAQAGERMHEHLA